MTTKNLFTIILKVLGLLLIRDSLSLWPQLFSVLYYLSNLDRLRDGIGNFIIIIIVFSIYATAVYYLIFKTDVIIDKLKLVEGFEEDNITLNMHRSAILSICVITIGGLMVADEIPNLCRQLTIYVQQRSSRLFSTDSNFSYSFFSAAKIMVGLLLMGHQRQIVNYIEYRRKK